MLDNLADLVEPHGGVLYRSPPRDLLGDGETRSPGGVLVDVVERDGGLHFEPPGGEALRGSPRRTVAFPDLPGNQVHLGIRRIDDSLTPDAGRLRSWSRRGRGFVGTAPEASLEGREVLLVVHGTFSTGEEMISALGPLIERARVPVLTFDYRSLSRHPLANALLLARLLRQHGVTGDVRVVCHSQGGLVVRFWLELIEPARLDRARVVFVAGTLAGTSLAAPDRLRFALDHLGNIASTLQLAGNFLAIGVPPFGIAAQLFGLVGGITGLASKGPLLDAGIALVPGFQGMSRVSTNAELDELRQALRSVPDGYFAISGAFEPPQLGWAFWRGWKRRLADGIVDPVFEGEHDLVVDTRSHTQLSDDRRIPTERTLHLQADTQVHHVNYFDRPGVQEYLARVLL